MRIYVAESPYFPAKDSDLVRRVSEADCRETIEVFSEPRPDITAEDARQVLQRIDGMVAAFKEPNTALSDKVMLAHELGKSVLLGINSKLNPEELLPSFGPVPQLTIEKRLARVYFYPRQRIDVHEPSVKIMRYGLSTVYIGRWLEGLAVTRYMKANAEPPTEEFFVIDQDNLRHGAEADTLPEE